MPQGRRKAPFSGKAKKEQLKVKKHGKSVNQPGNSRNVMFLRNNSDEEPEDNFKKLNHQPNKAGRNTNKYALQFYRESAAEIRERKEQARHALKPTGLKDLEIKIEDYFPPEFDFPKRPEWSFDISKEVLEAKENRYFTEYVKKLEEQFGWKEMSFFELNLETWRQLWRVLEISDIILLVVDARFPAIMFPPSLYTFITNTLKKQMILVLNKIDLVPTPLVAAWKNYFLDKFPELTVLMFTTVPQYNLFGKMNDKAGLQIRRRKGRIRMAAEGTKLLLDACRNIVKDEVDLSLWEEKIKQDSSTDFNDDDKVEIGETIIKTQETGFSEHERYKNGILTIGCLGQPNVGKSSLMNAIMGKKVVSVSKTPGHTKHFQTIFLTPNVRLCDCPGLVFPSKVPKVLQVLMGSFPIAQLSEPFATIRYLAERLDLPKILRMEHPDGDDVWCAMDICDGWAKKRGYLTAKAGRLDSYRAANSLLRMALDGKICLCLTPENYHEKQDYWQNHPDCQVVRWIKAITEEESFVPMKEESEYSEEEISDVDQHSENEKPEEECDSDESEEIVAASNKFAALLEENN